MGTTGGRILHFDLDPKNFRFSCSDLGESGVTDLIRSKLGNQEFYVSGHSNGSIRIVKNPDSLQKINLKEADNN